MPDIDAALAVHTEKLRKILAKKKAGKQLTPAELAVIGVGDQGQSTPEQTSYDSLQAAAAALNVPKATLQWAKDQGAPGFKGSRVYPLQLLPWLRQTAA